MPRRRLIRTQIPKSSEESVEPTTDGEGSTPKAKELQPSEDSTATSTTPNEPVTVPAEPAPQQSTLRRSRRTAPDASPAVEESSGNSDAVKCQEVVKDTGTETVMKTPVIRLTRVSRRNLSPQKTNVDIKPQEDEKENNGEAPATEVKETVRGRRGRAGLRTQSPGKAVQKCENTVSTLESAKAETAQVETPVGDSTKNLEEADSLKVVKGTEDYNPKGSKSPRIIKRRNLCKTPKHEKEHEELVQNEPVIEAENVTDLEKNELKVGTILDGREENGKGNEESAVEVKIKESAAGVKVEVSNAEVKIEVRDDDEGEKMECDVQDRESCSTDKLISETSVVVTAVKKEMDGEAPSQNMEKVSDAPTKNTRGRRTLKRAADKENVNAPEAKVLIKECEETESQSTEIVKGTPSRIVRQRKGIKETLDKKVLQMPEHKVSVKIETDLQSTEKLEGDNVQVEVSGSGELKEELSEIEKAKVGTIRKDIKEMERVQSGDILEKMLADDKIETIPTEKSKGSVCTVPKGKEEAVEISKESETGESSKVNIVKVDTIQKPAAEEVLGIETVDVSKKSGRLVGRSSTINTIKVDAVKEPSTEELAVKVTVDVPKKNGRGVLGRSSKINPVKLDTTKEPATGEVPSNQTEVRSCDIDEKMEVEDVMDPLHKENVEDCLNETLEDKKEIPNAADKTLEDQKETPNAADKTLEDKKESPNATDKEVLDETFEAEEINFEDFIEVDGVDNFDEMGNADVPGEEQEHGSTNDDEELDYEDAEDNVEDDVSSLDADELLIIEDDAEYRSLFDEEITAAEEARAQNKQAKGKDMEKKRSPHGGKPDEKGKKDDASKGSQDNRRKKDNDPSRRKSPEPRDRSRTTRSRRKSPEAKDRKSPESRSRKSSPESKNRRRSPESRDKKRNADSKGRKKSPESRDKRKSPETCEKSKRKIEDQDKKKDSQCRNDRRRSKSPPKADSKKDPTTGCKLQINIRGDVKKTNSFRQVVVLANSIYKIQLKGLENSHVKVVYEDNLSSQTVIYNIQKHRKEFGKNTLWILLSGVYTFVDDEKAKSCKNCKEPLRLMKLNHNPMVDYLLQLCRVTCDTVQYRLGSDGLITTVPPLPALLALTDNYNTHKKLHDAADGYNLIAAKTSYEKMRKKYNAFCRSWTENACERNKSWISVEAFQEYMNRGEANLFPMFSKDRYETRLKNWFEAMEKFVNLVLETTFPGVRVIESLSTSRTMDSTKEPPPPGEPESDDMFNKVVVVGNTSFTKDLQELTKDLNIEHLNENVDFDEDGLKFLNELQNKHPSRTLWVVLSGVSEVAEPLESGPPKCKILNCNEPIPVFVTKNDKLGDPDFKDMEIDRMVSIIVKEAFDFATIAIKKLKEGSGIFLAPIMPLCAIWSGHATSHSHDALHRMYKRDPNVPHFIGGSSVWIKCAKALERKWLYKIVGSFKRDSYPSELMKEYKQEKPPVLQYVEDVTVPQVKDVQKAWSKMMAKLLRYYLLGSKSEVVSEPVVNPVPAKGPVTLHSQGADFGPPGVGTEAVVLMDPQTQVNGATPGVIETFPHCAAPVGYSDMLISPQYPALPAQPLPVVVAAAPQPITAFQGAIAYPGPTQQGIPFQGFPGPQSHDPYFTGWPAPVNPTIAAASVPAFVPSVSVAPVSEASPAVAGSCTIQAPPKLKTAMKGHLVIQNLETDMNESQARTLLQEFGELGEMKWPLNQKDQPARFLMINYKQRKHAERAERILNYLKVFGDNSVVKLIGGDKKEDANKLESEDLELLLSIHDVLNKIKKESKMNKVQQVPLYPQSSRSTVKPVVADSVAPLQVPVTPVLTIVVSNFTDIVSVKDINEMFVELGACGKGVLIQNALHFTFKGDSAVVNLLSGYRFPDKKMEVIVKASTNEIKPTNKAVKEAKAKIEGPLSKLMKKIGNVLKEEVDAEMNVYTFKTRLCRYADGCKAKDLCPKFHDAGDRRRCLILHRYSDEMCTVLEESGSCEAKDKCSNAHSPLEILFHFKNFRSSICPGWQQNRACDKVGRVCSYVHPGKPEMLYNDKWDNLYVEGLKKTLAYLTEAVKNLFLVKDLQCLRVLLITVSPELAKLYVDCITELAKCCNQKVSYSAGDTVEDGTTVLITTLDALRRLVNVNKPQQSKLDTTRLRALILDDGPALLQNCPKFIQNYFSDLARKDVNVVITANKILNKEVEDAQVKIHPRGGFKKIFVENVKKKDSKPRSSAKAGSYRGDVLERVSASTRSSDTKPVPKKTSESQSSKDKTDKGLENKSSSKEKTSTTWSSSKGSSSRSSSSKDSSSSSQKLEERVKTLAALEIEYKKALDEMDKEQERELELYINSPEFHPEYEQKYSIFMEQYKVQYPERSDMEHSNNLWEEFWKELITLLLQEEYDTKKQDLEKVYKDKKEKACKGTPSRDSREKENQQDEAKQGRKSSESQKRKSSTDNRDNHREKSCRSERSSDVGRGTMNQNRNEDGLRGRTHQRNRNEDSDTGRKQQYNRSEEFSRDSVRAGHQYLGQEKSSNYGGMQQNSNKEEFNKGRMQQSSVPGGNKESSTTDMRETINLLQELCPSLGVLGPAAQLLMRKITVCWSDRQELGKLVQNEDSKLILMRLSEKALGVSQMYGSGPQAMKLRLASSHALKLLNTASLPVENSKFYGLNIEDLAKMTYNMDPAYIVQCIKSALTAQGIYNASEKEVTDIYVAVTSAHFGIAYSKSGEAAQPKTQESRQGDSGLLKRGRPGWNDDDDEGSRPKRVGASWLGSDLGVNSSNVTQGRQTGGKNEYGGYGSDKQFGRSDVSLWNAKTNETVNSSQKGSFGYQKAQDFGQQQVTDYGHKSTNSFSIGMNMNNDSSNMEFSRLGNFSSLSSNFNSGTQVRNMSGGSGMSAGFSQRGNQIGENFNMRRTQMGSRFNQREEKQMQGNNSSGQQGNQDELSMIEFLSRW
ncbi:uncharacterized protein LOC135205676 [Macrobrachium nipponense]|uniref:uncharacterized protein LOC135205676 n=1 Tax=Macrobrachium nipponense TaxID=159736 RepID=UPI0030C82C90